jgi:hypothetical protein
VALLDTFGNPILYFPARTAAPNVHLAGGYLPAVVAAPPANNDASLYDVFDNWVHFKRSQDGNNNVPAQQRIHVLLGDIVMAPAAQEGAIITGTDDLKPVSAPYLLWSTGPDNLFGPLTVTDGGSPINVETNRTAVTDCDDVTNFR